jgi:hypothetical protein
MAVRVVTRFARDKDDHFALRSLLQSLGISLRSATEPPQLAYCVTWCVPTCDASMGREK